MIRAHTVEQVRSAEHALIRTLPDGTLMQRAATGLAHAVADYLGSVYGRTAVLLVGAGDNGGDALYAGAQLARRGAAVEAWLLSERAHRGGVEALRTAGGRVTVATSSPPPVRRRPDVVVDGIVGIGGRPGLRPAAVAALDALAGVPVVAVDVPSGVDVDTGEVDGPHVRADLTVTFGTHKVAHLVDPAAGAVGALHLVDIGLDPHLEPAAVTALRPEDVAALLPRPRSDAHKYTRGVVGVRAGSATYPGAARLSVAGASCGLAGMVRYVGPDEAAAAVRADHPEVVGPGRVQAWVVGSGSDAGAETALREAVADDVPVLVDADALAAVEVVAGRGAVLTPHAGELARMLDEDRAAIEARGLHHARRAAARWQAVVLLKGRHTLVAAPDGRVAVTTTGTPWLATAGAGDVLGGVIGALLAAGLDPFDAAALGSWVHGGAATLARRDGPIVAGDVARALPATLATVMGQSGP
ncbi:NAD(P)H-hydrate epimerase [Nocardioides sambongensis]|uniref:NAD(P)H-hydrate epimerase n=1 Tax=Nocardioides sambongensis TaxID=2589074 RepID=UPI00112ED24A|nr:NAD(P)H-hydrate epimerase [Nocardioides sambongensis]